MAMTMDLTQNGKQKGIPAYRMGTSWRLVEKDIKWLRK
jgi:hypothetical protein